MLRGVKGELKGSFNEHSRSILAFSCHFRPLSCFFLTLSFIFVLNVNYTLQSKITHNIYKYDLVLWVEWKKKIFIVLYKYVDYHLGEIFFSVQWLQEGGIESPTFWEEGHTNYQGAKLTLVKCVALFCPLFFHPRLYFIREEHDPLISRVAK